MTGKRINIYLDEGLHKRVARLLEQSPEPYSFSRLVSELLSDWYDHARLAPRFKDATPEERRDLALQLGFHQVSQVVDEVRTTLRKISVGEEDGT